MFDDVIKISGQERREFNFALSHLMAVCSEAEANQTPIDYKRIIGDVHDIIKTAHGEEALQRFEIDVLRKQTYILQRKNNEIQKEIEYLKQLKTKEEDK